MSIKANVRKRLVHFAMLVALLSTLAFSTAIQPAHAGGCLIATGTCGG